MTSWNRDKMKKAELKYIMNHTSSEDQKERIRNILILNNPLLIEYEYEQSVQSVKDERASRPKDQALSRIGKSDLFERIYKDLTQYKQESAEHPLCTYIRNKSPSYFVKDFDKIPRLSFDNPNYELIQLIHEELDRETTALNSNDRMILKNILIKIISDYTLIVRDESVAKIRNLFSVFMQNVTEEELRDESLTLLIDASENIPDHVFQGMLSAIPYIHSVVDIFQIEEHDDAPELNRFHAKYYSFLNYLQCSNAVRHCHVNKQYTAKFCKKNPLLCVEHFKSFFAFLRYARNDIIRLLYAIHEKRPKDSYPDMDSSEDEENEEEEEEEESIQSRFNILLNRGSKLFEKKIQYRSREEEELSELFMKIKQILVFAVNLTRRKFSFETKEFNRIPYFRDDLILDSERVNLITREDIQCIVFALLNQLLS